MTETKHDRGHRPGKFIWFEHVSSDPARAQAFYRELFGWTTQAFGPGYDLIMIDGEMAGGYAAPRAGEAAHWLSCAAVPDVDAACAAATEAGGRVVDAPRDAPGVGRLARIADPQGVEVSLLRGEQGDPPDRPHRVHQFAWNELHTSDAESAVAFYERVFGYSHRAHDMGPYGIYYTLASAGADRGAIMRSDPGQPSLWWPYIAVADADAAIARAAAAGAAVHVPALDIPGIGRFGVLADPTGAVFAVIRPLAI